MLLYIAADVKAYLLKIKIAKITAFSASETVVTLSKTLAFSSSSSTASNKGSVVVEVVAADVALVVFFVGAGVEAVKGAAAKESK